MPHKPAEMEPCITECLEGRVTRLVKVLVAVVSALTIGGLAAAPAGGRRRSCA